VKLSFYGAAETVTGSKYLLENGSKKVLVDCGLFQGLKKLRLRNWEEPPFDVAGLDAVVLTHAHIDHSGYLPVLMKKGFKGPVYCTSGTRDLCSILLPDSGHLQEEEAEFLTKHKYSRHDPALPLYTREDAERCLKLLRVVDFDTDFDHSSGRRLLDSDLVERPQTVRHHAVDNDVGLDRDPRLDGVAAIDDVLSYSVEVVLLGFCEKPDPPNIDAEQWRALRSGQFGTTQNGAVTAHDHHELDRCCSVPPLDIRDAEFLVFWGWSKNGDAGVL